MSVLYIDITVPRDNYLEGLQNLSDGISSLLGDANHKFTAESVPALYEGFTSSANIDLRETIPNSF